MNQSLLEANTVNTYPELCFAKRNSSSGWAELSSVDLRRFELLTFALQMRRSNQLSYRPT